MEWCGTMYTFRQSSFGITNMHYIREYMLTFDIMIIILKHCLKNEWLWDKIHWYSLNILLMSVIYYFQNKWKDFTAGNSDSVWGHKEALSLSKPFLFNNDIPSTYLAFIVIIFLIFVVCLFCQIIGLQFSALWDWFEWDAACWCTISLYGWNQETWAAEEATCKAGIISRPVLTLMVCLISFATGISILHIFCSLKVASLNEAMRRFKSN